MNTGTSFQSVAAKKNGIVIERGPVGRYQLLPEAETEMVPISVRCVMCSTCEMHPD